MSLLPLTTEIFRDKYDFCHGWYHGFQRYSLCFSFFNYFLSFPLWKSHCNVGSLYMVVKVAVNT